MMLTKVVTVAFISLLAMVPREPILLWRHAHLCFDRHQCHLEAVLYTYCHRPSSVEPT